MLNISEIILVCHKFYRNVILSYFHPLWAAMYYSLFISSSTTTINDKKNGPCMMHEPLQMLKLDVLTLQNLFRSLTRSSFMYIQWAELWQGPCIFLTKLSLSKIDTKAVLFFLLLFCLYLTSEEWSLRTESNNTTKS